MATNTATIKAMERIRDALKRLGVKSNDLKTFDKHIAQQRRQPAYDLEGRYIGKANKKGGR